MSSVSFLAVCSTGRNETPTVKDTDTNFNVCLIDYSFLWIVLFNRKKIREQRDNVLSELLVTEYEYCRDLRLTAQVFHLEDDQYLKQKGIDSATLFGNLLEVIAVILRYINTTLLRYSITVTLQHCITSIRHYDVTLLQLHYNIRHYNVILLQLNYNIRHSTLYY